MSSSDYVPCWTKHEILSWGMVSEWIWYGMSLVLPPPLLGYSVNQVEKKIEMSRATVQQITNILKARQ